MQHSSPVNTTFILLVTATHEDLLALIAKSGKHDLSRRLHYRLAVLQAALCRVETMRRNAVKALLAQPRDPST
jgi:hypothetical protein